MTLSAYSSGYILPLTERISRLLPYCDLRSGTKQILQSWKQQGEGWTTSLIENSNRAEKAELDAKEKEEREYEAFLAFLAA